MTIDIKKKLMESQVNYYNEKNLDLFCACYHPEVEVSFLGLENKEKGMNLFRAKYKNLFDSSPDLHCEIKSRIYLNNFVVDEEFVTGSSKYPNGVHAVLIYGFKDDLIASVCLLK